MELSVIAVMTWRSIQWSMLLQTNEISVGTEDPSTVYNICQGRQLWAGDSLNLLLSRLKPQGYQDHTSHCMPGQLCVFMSVHSHGTFGPLLLLEAVEQQQEVQNGPIMENP